MQCLLDDQLKKKLTEQEEKRKSAQNRSDGNSGAGKTGSLALGIMSRSNKLLKLWR